MNKELNRFFENRANYGPTFIRLAIGFYLFYGVHDNIISWQRMQEFAIFLDSNHFPLPLLCAIVSVYAQGLCGLLIILGAFTKIASSIMIINFLVAIGAVHWGDTYLNTFSG